MSEGSEERQADSWLGRVLAGRYRVERLLGSGAMGRVYAAVHQELDKPVAIKVLRSEWTESDELLARFRREARAAAHIEHANVCRAFDFATTEDGHAFLVMEYLEGSTLTELLKLESRLAPPRALNIATQICSGLAAAHERGIVHRDLKPDNILLVDREGDRDFVKLLDFGLAGVQRDDGPNDVRLTQVGKVYGTPQYMSPEQAMGALVDHRADIYALGVILYEMLEGHPPFVADDTMDMLRMHLVEPAPRLAGSRVDVPRELADAVSRMLSKSRTARYADAGEVKRALERISAHSPLGVSSGDNQQQDDHEAPLHLATTLAGTTESADLTAPPSGIHEVRADVIRLVPRDIATRYSVVPLRREGAKLFVAMADPSAARVISDIAFLTGYTVEVVQVPAHEIALALERYYGV